jgi:hypothetical protein
MCNLYSITTNQAAIADLFRVVRRYEGNLAPMPGVFPDYPRASHSRRGRRARDGADALGHAAAAAHRRPARDEHSQHLVAALARVAQAGASLSRPGQQLCRIRPGAQSGNHRRKTSCGSRLRTLARCSRSPGFGPLSMVIAAPSQSPFRGRIGFTAFSPRRRTQSLSQYIRRRCR